MKQLAAMLALGLLSVAPITATGEVIGHISDETKPAAPSDEWPRNDDRRIIYRVICTPGGEILPDCERPVEDVETVAPPPPPPAAPQTTDKLPLNDEAAEQEAIPSPDAAKAKTAAAKKKSLKKSKRSRKSSARKKGGKKAVARKKARKK